MEGYTAFISERLDLGIGDARGSIGGKCAYQPTHQENNSFPSLDTLIYTGVN